ncbi:hypothetical protein SDC9_129801 [bioreactor metagenome]|uniref:NAD-specific glutamate dehydrogenase n=1 Tax=bioreactor metagenome TaxID=1076179 RepID=A0A645D0P3_9ZZZZ
MCFARVLREHAIAHKAIAHSHHGGHLADVLGHLQHGGDHVGRGGVGAHDLQQLHHVGGTEEMQAHHVLRAMRDRGDLVDVQARRVGGKDRTGLGDLVELSEQIVLDRHVFECRFDHQIHISELLHVGGAVNALHTCLHFCRGELALADGGVVVALNGGKALLQIGVGNFHQRNGIARVGKRHGNATPHGPRADHADALYRAQRGILCIARRLGGFAFCKEQMANGFGLGAVHQFHKAGTFKLQAVFQCAARGFFDAGNALQRRIHAARCLASVIAGLVKQLCRVGRHVHG